jgi:hypothetical protein
MAIEQVLDSVRRIIHKWVDTISPISANVDIGDSQISVDNTIRFQVNDEVMLKNSTVYETGLTIKSIDSDTTLTFNSDVLNNWTVAENAQLVKTTNEQFVQGIYIGDPEVIPRYPAITVNGSSRSSEWLTLESTKERYEIEVTVLVEASTHEGGYRFLLNMTDIIQKGLKRNIIPLVNDYEVVSLARDISIGEVNIPLTDVDNLAYYGRILIENQYDLQENWVDVVYADVNPSDGNNVHLVDPVCYNFSASNTSVVIPHRFIFNSWPANIDYGKLHKGQLLKASVIRWFAEEEEMQYLRRTEPQLY